MRRRQISFLCQIDKYVIKCFKNIIGVCGILSRLFWISAILFFFEIETGNFKENWSTEKKTNFYSEWQN